MSTLRVPQDYPTIQAAVNAAAAGDTVVIAANYTVNEAVTVSVDGLLIGGTSKAAVTLTLGSGVTTLHLGGTLPYAVVGNDAGDMIFGGKGANSITAGIGNDRIFAGVHDTIDAGKGDDVIFLSGTPVEVDGGDGDDIVRITGNVTFAANSVANVEQFSVGNGVTGDFGKVGFGVIVRALSARGGTTTVRGTAFADMFYSGDGADRFTGNGGTDTVSYDASGTGVTASLGTPATNTGSASGDTYSGVENLTGSRFNDVLSGDAGANLINGGAGDDTIYGGSGDTLQGGFGNDTFIVAGKLRSIDGGAPQHAKQPDTDVLKIVGDTSFYGGSKLQHLSRIEVADGVTLDLTGTTLSDIPASPQFALISQSVAGGGSTIVCGNQVIGLTGGLGADTLIGGDSTPDPFTIAATPHLVQAGRQGGYVTITGSDVQITSDNFKNIFEFIGNRVDCSQYLYTGPGFFRIADEGTDPVIVGTAGDDIIYGDAPGGRITGGAGADSIFLFDQATTVAYHAGDTGLTADSIDTVTGFQTGAGKVRIDGIGSAAARYAETAIKSGSFGDALAAANAVMAGGGKDAVFVAGGAHHDGFLFWNPQAGHTAASAAIKLIGGGGLSFFSNTDLG